MSDKQLKETPLAKKRRENAQKTPLIENLIQTTTLTTHEIAKQLGVTDRRVASVATKLGVDMHDRTAYSYAGRGNKISQSLRQNGSAKRANAQRRHQVADIAPDYLGQIPDWAWRVIDAQPEPLLIDKLIGLSERPESTVALFTEAELALGRKVSAVELNDYIPHIAGVDLINKQLSLRQPNSSAIANVAGSQSLYESRVANLLNELGVTYLTRTRQFGFELDFYLPEQKLAIEVSPLATHNSNRYRHFGLTTAKPKRASYHEYKYKTVAKQGATLITLFEKQLDPDVWVNKTVPMLRRLVTGHADVTLYARQTEIKLMSQPDDKKLVDAFLERYHMDGKTPARIRYGMFYRDELVGVATFSLPTTPAYKDGQTLELKRLAFKSDVQVRYGISKIVAQLSRDFPEYNWLMTYSNNNMGHGNGYERAGFTFVKDTGAQLTFVNPKNPLDTYSWSVATPWGAKSGVIAKLLGSQFVSNDKARFLVETALPHRTDDGKGYVAFYDTGNKLWTKTLHN